MVPFLICPTALITRWLPRNTIELRSARNVARRRKPRNEDAPTKSLPLPRGEGRALARLSARACVRHLEILVDRYIVLGLFVKEILRDIDDVVALGDGHADAVLDH
jgi:hypothetical protein